MFSAGNSFCLTASKSTLESIKIDLNQTVWQMNWLFWSSDSWKSGKRLTSSGLTMIYCRNKCWSKITRWVNAACGWKRNCLYIHVHECTNLTIAWTKAQKRWKSKYKNIMTSTRVCPLRQLHYHCKLYIYVGCCRLKVWVRIISLLFLQARGALAHSAIGSQEGRE